MNPATMSRVLAHVALYYTVVAWPFISPLAWLDRAKMLLKIEEQTLPHMVLNFSRNQHVSSAAHEQVVRRVNCRLYIHVIIFV